MPPAPTGGTPKLSEAARTLVMPSGIIDSKWGPIRDRCTAMGIQFERWQDGLGAVAFGVRDGGVYAASVGGVVMSIPRQVGKTFFVGAVAFALCMAEPRAKVIWTAHHSNTADETFDSMSDMARRPKVWPHVRQVRTGNGKQVIIFRNGSRVEFGARERGFGRGKQRVSLLVLDEAQILSESAMENMVPSLNRGPNPLMFMMGTPPRPQDPSEVFANKRARALSGESDDVLYVEFSADTDAKLDDRAQWAKANPSYPQHTPDEALLRMRESFGDGGFRREALGIWDEGVTANATIPAGKWSAGVVEIAPAGRPAYGVKFSLDGERVSVAAAVPDGESIHVEVIAQLPTADPRIGDVSLTDWLAASWRDSLGIVIDGKAGAGSLEADLARLKVPKRRVHMLTTPEAITAHAQFLEAVQQGRLTHIDQAELNAAVKVATKRTIGTLGGWGWQAIGDGNVLDLEAATLAAWGAKRNIKTLSTVGGRGGVL